MNRTINTINSRAEEIATLVLEGNYEEATKQYQSQESSCDKELARMTKILSLAVVKKKSPCRYSDFKRVFANGFDLFHDNGIRVQT